MKLGTNEDSGKNPPDAHMTFRGLLRSMLPDEATDAVFSKIARTCCRFLGIPEKCSCERTTLDSDGWLSWPSFKLARIVSRMVKRVRKHFMAMKMQTAVPA